ncbi:MAG TPA: hypothetical protein ENK63_04140 [Rhodobacterales bacterium]|nr:hypothetical protein [Rhodobacterales bacterium]
MLIRLLASILFAVMLALPARAACPDDAAARLYGLGAQARGGADDMAAMSEAAVSLLKACGEDRVILSLVFQMFAAAGLAIEPPDPKRFQAQLFAFRTLNRILRAGAGGFAPPKGINWSVDDERNAVWDLMFAMSGDFLVFGANAALYTPGQIEKIGCGLYPAEEESALAEQARGNLDGGELLARVVYLARKCDTPEHEVAGYAALYFAHHAEARAADPDGYAGVTERDIRTGLNSFLDQHLGDAAQSWLFDADEVSRLRGF